MIITISFVYTIFIMLHNFHLSTAAALCEISYQEGLCIRLEHAKCSAQMANVTSDILIKLKLKIVQKMAII